MSCKPQSGSLIHRMKGVRFNYSAHTYVQRWAAAFYPRPALALALVGVWLHIGADGRCRIRTHVSIRPLDDVNLVFRGSGDGGHRHALQSSDMLMAQADFQSYQRVDFVYIGRPLDQSTTPDGVRVFRILNNINCVVVPSTFWRGLCC